MILQRRPSREVLAHDAAAYLAERAREAIAERGAFAIALSGGSTPWVMLAELARMDCEWAKWHVFQVDERAAPDGDEKRNWTHVQRSFTDHVAIPAEQLHPMPVLEGDRVGAAQAYEAALPPALDVVQLGLGDDGHTASLVPGDAVLEVRDRTVAWTGATYRGHDRMTLTYPAIALAREVVWLVAGADKQPILDAVLAGDRPDYPATRVARGVVFVSE